MERVLRRGSEPSDAVIPDDAALVQRSPRASTVNAILRPKGVGVVIKAVHHCLSTRGVHKHDTGLMTSHMLGRFRDDTILRREFLGTVG